MEYPTWVDINSAMSMHQSLTDLLNRQTRLSNIQTSHHEEGTIRSAAPYDYSHGFDPLHHENCSCLQISPEENYMGFNNRVMGISHKSIPSSIPAKRQRCDFDLTDHHHHQQQLEQQHHNNSNNVFDPTKVSSSLPAPFVISNDDCSSTSLLSQLNIGGNDNNNNDNEQQGMGAYRSYFQGVIMSEKVPMRSKSQRESHILAERLRREEMNEKFSILRSLIPNLTKKDKASIVTDTINYLMELEKKAENLKAFQANRKNCGKIKKRNTPCEKVTTLLVDNNTEQKPKDTNMMDENQLSKLTCSEHWGKDKSGDGKTSSHIEVQKLGTQAVIKILCQRSRGLILRTHTALYRCKIDILQSNVTTFGENVVHYLTIQLNPGVSSSVDGLVNALQQACSS